MICTVFMMYHLHMLFINDNKYDMLAVTATKKLYWY